jgi:hypothetical protein
MCHDPTVFQVLLALGVVVFAFGAAAVLLYFGFRDDRNRDSSKEKEDAIDALANSLNDDLRERQVRKIYERKLYNLEHPPSGP